MANILRRYVNEIFSNFFLTKPIPIDTRYWIDSLANLDTEIPLNLRYEGLTFFVSTGVDDGEIGKDNQKGCLYLFEKDLTKPKKLKDAILRYNITGLPVDFDSLKMKWNYIPVNIDEPVVEYETLDELLEENTYKNLGTVIYLKYIQVSIVWDGSNWKYFSGEWLLNTEKAWDKVPTNLKKEKVVVLIGDVTKPTTIKKFIVDSALKLTYFVYLSKEHIDIWSKSAYPNDRYVVDMNGNLHISVGGNSNDSEIKIYKISRKSKIIKAVLNIGETVIRHDLNLSNNFLGGSPSLEVYLQIDDKKNIEINNIIQLEVKNITSNTCVIVSKIKTEGFLHFSTD